jgi:capsular polysaccharide biosynthesis protein
VEVPRLLRSLRRRWRVWALGALGGLLLALAWMAANPQYSATTTLLLRYPASVDPARGMATDVQLVSSRTVAERAMARLGAQVPADQFLTTYTAVAPTDQVLQVTATMTTGAEALRRVAAVGDAFLGLRRYELETEARVAIGALEARKKELQGELGTVDAEIGNLAVTAGDPNAPPDPSLGGTDGLTSLVSRRATITTELSDIGRRIEDSALETATVLRNSRVLDAPAVHDFSHGRTLVRTLALGLVLGLALGVGLVVVQETISDRVHRRDDIMAALRSPVMVSVGRVAGPLRPHGRRPRPYLGRSDGENRDVTRIVDHLRGVLATDTTPTPGLVVISVDSDAAAALSLVTLAHQLKDEGRTVLLADFSKRLYLAGLCERPAETMSRVHAVSGAVWMACERPDGRDAGDNVGFGAGVAKWRTEADVMLALVTLDPAHCSDPLRGWPTDAVVMVTAGRSSATRLQSVARLARAANLRLHSTVVVGADRTDETVGLPETFVAEVAAQASDGRARVSVGG